MAFVVNPVQTRRIKDAVIGIEAQIADAIELVEKASALSAKSEVMLTAVLRELEELYMLFNNDCSLDESAIEK